MSDYHMSWRQRWSELLADAEKGVVVGNKNLYEIAHLGDFSRRADEVRHGPRGTIPHENMEPFFTKVRRHPASNNAKTDYSDIFSRSTGHIA